MLQNLRFPGNYERNKSINPDLLIALINSVIKDRSEKIMFDFQKPILNSIKK